MNEPIELLHGLEPNGWCSPMFSILYYKYPFILNMEAPAFDNTRWVAMSLREKMDDLAPGRRWWKSSE